MSTIYENLLFLGGYVTDPYLFDGARAAPTPAASVAAAVASPAQPGADPINACPA